jgi:thiol-disulfide isomerase/thioredoxin
MLRKLVFSFLTLALIGESAMAADLVRVVRLKLAAGDLATGVAAVEDYKKEKGIDGEYLDAVGWLARGAEMQRRTEVARELVAELHREIPKETAELLAPYGAAIEVESKLIAAQSGRGSAVRYLENELARADAPALRSRIRKNINLLTIEGHPAPALTGSDFIGSKTSLESLKGKPVVLFFFAQGCGDCKAQAPSLQRVWEKYRSQDVNLIAITRYYGSLDDKPATPAEEKARVAKVWGELYPALKDVPVLIDLDTMVRYGASATPTFALIDRKGVVRLYTPTRLSEAELSRRIDELLAEAR